AAPLMRLNRRIRIFDDILKGTEEVPKREQKKKKLFLHSSPDGSPGVAFNQFNNIFIPRIFADVIPRSASDKES
ncbi:MAG TPA: hypothetical protein VKN73_03425, partial [Desulfosalsimonadaceae bacterium]|nr:hypothetical protein [Desulfosalsimonadaceae bacterium]